MAHVVHALKTTSELVYESRRPLPLGPDGLTAAEAAPAVLGIREKHGKLFGIIDEIQGAIERGLPIELDEQTLLAFEDAAVNGTTTVGIDDRLYIMEKILILMSRLPPNSEIQIKLRDLTIGFLYRDLPHPPSTHLGQQYQFRTVDGSFNNVSIPNLGQARTPYARSVQSRNPIPLSARPDPGLVFDALLRREGTHPHPAGLSSLFFAFANVIIHTLFKTDERNPNINNASSYVDLSPLYGDSDESTQAVRKLDGYGMIWEDTFADQRLLFMPPSTGAVLIIFNRNHNYIAQRLLQINENRAYVQPPINDVARLIEQDNDIFNRARLINCAHVMNIILSDYLGAILNLVKDGSLWTLDPSQEARLLDHHLTDRGLGNSVSIEFNLLYRWHATISEPDEAWTRQLFKQLFPDVDPERLTPDQFYRRLQDLRVSPSSVAKGEYPTAYAQSMGNAAARTPGDGYGPISPPRPQSGPIAASAAGGPRHWTFGGLRRDPHTGRFKDDDLANILHNATATVAQGYRARGTPEALRVVEIIAIEQGRQWGACTLNEFRQFIGLKAYSSFEEWNPDPTIANAARALYGHVDQLELYVGMQAEEPKVPGDGAGLCPGYTVSRAILGDAVALVRGDRFFTTDFTPYNLTAWGFQDCARDIQNGGFGSGMSKLLLRSLPNNYSYDSVYGLFPFLTPNRMHTILEKLGTAERYDFKRPSPQLPVVLINSWEGATQVLADFRIFKMPASNQMKKLTKGYGFFMASDDPSSYHKDLELMRSAIESDQRILKEFVGGFQQTTVKLIEEKAFVLVGKEPKFVVDIVRDVLNLVPVYWASVFVAGIPLKTTTTPRGIHTEQEVYSFLATVYTYVYLNSDVESGWKLERIAESVAKMLQYYIKDNLEAVEHIHKLGHLEAKFLDRFTGEDNKSFEFLKRLVDSGRSIDELTVNVFGLITTIAPNFSLAATLIVDFYLDDQRKAEREDIAYLCRDETAEAHARLLGYILEALRLDPQTSGIILEATADASVTESRGHQPVHITRTQKVFVSLKNACLDPHTFGPNPTVVDPTRPLSKYSLLIGDGLHSSLPRWLVEHVLPPVIRAVFSLKNVRRAPGHSGHLNRFRQELFGTTPSWLYVDAKGDVSPWPSSLMVEYDL